MDLRVGINEGRIEVRQARREGVVRFDTDAEAVSYLSHHVAQMARRVEFAPSCDRPDLAGRPGFSRHQFKSMLDAEVAKFGGMRASTLAA